MAATASSIGLAPAGLHPQHLILYSSATFIIMGSTDHRDHAAFAGFAIDAVTIPAPTGYLAPGSGVVS